MHRKWTFLIWILDGNIRPGHSGGGLHKRQSSQHGTFFRNLVLFQSDDGGYYGHGTRGKATERNNTHLNNIFVSFCGYQRNTNTRLD
jgi:hypothetical protein